MALRAIGYAFPIQLLDAFFFCIPSMNVCFCDAVYLCFESVSKSNP